MKETRISRWVCLLAATAIGAVAMGQQQQQPPDEHHRQNGEHTSPGQTATGPNHVVGTGFGSALARARSRSGTVHYGTISNGYSRSVPFFVPRPQGLPPITSRNYVLKHYGGIWYGMRVGYVSYFPGFVDDQFFYPFYSFDPDANQTILLSPWYYYPSLPPYIDANRTDPSVVTPPPPDPSSTGIVVTTDQTPPVTPPAVTPPQPDATPIKKDLDQAQKDLVNAWQAQDLTAAERLVPATGTVTVHVDGEDPYTLNAKDFYDLLHDGIEGVKTVSYVLDVPKMVNDDMATVVAHHTFMDPFGQQKEIDHTYTLVQSAQGWVISEFASGSYKPTNGNQ